MKKKKDILYFITGNNHKFNEISLALQSKNIKYQLKQLNINLIEIQSDNPKEIAFFKLRSIKDDIKGSYFIEDAGFFIDYPLNGFPGVYSSYIFRTIGNEGVLKLIDNFEITKAHFSSIIALYFKPLEKEFLFEGIIEGRVSPRIRGTNGFGYDPIFIPNDYPDKTFAEINMNEKNNISHRGLAIKKLVEFLKKN
ncbi:MAG: RdgB/HAM1 family non-canonical purine NTP pyrophosphatase [Candidatus Lokiarchaeota archaeon]|nr:RdgB/HAM1 family non-canonical purine NTP pyrophosphatase [Candidatus Lokiarchaeota archaeon]